MPVEVIQDWLGRTPLTVQTATGMNLKAWFEMELAESEKLCELPNVSYDPMAMALQGLWTEAERLFKDLSTTEGMEADILARMKSMGWTPPKKDDLTKVWANSAQTLDELAVGALIQAPHGVMYWKTEKGWTSVNNVIYAAKDINLSARILNRGLESSQK